MHAFEEQATKSGGERNDKRAKQAHENKNREKLCTHDTDTRSPRGGLLNISLRNYHFLHIVGLLYPDTKINEKKKYTRKHT